MIQIKRKNKYINGIDGLRFLALIGVLGYHLFPRRVQGGFFGVVLFFVISGFLSGVSCADYAKDKSFRLGKYYKDRAIRIYIPLIVVIFVTMGVMTYFFPIKLANSQQEIISILLGYNNYWQLHMNADYFANIAQNSPFTHLWYIAILIQFELLWGIVTYFYVKIKKAQTYKNFMLVFWIITILSFFVMPIMALSGVDITAMYYRTSSRIFSLLAGALMGIYYGRGYIFLPYRNKAIAHITMTECILITIVMYFAIPGSSKYVYLFGMAFYTLLCCLMTQILLYRKNRVSMVIGNKIFKGISKYSYEIYLWQYPVIFIVNQFNPPQNIYYYLSILFIISFLSIWLHSFTRLFTPKTVRVLP